MVFNKEDVVAEYETQMLIRSASAYIRQIYEQCAKDGVPKEQTERLVSNFSFFILNFIVFNEPREEEKQRMRELIRETLEKCEKN